jgi:hypothetical protein
MRRKGLALAWIVAIACTHAPKPARQNPSPMVDNTRAHERLQQRPIEGAQFSIEQGQVMVTLPATAAGEGDLLIHFHGSAWLPFSAAAGHGALVVAAINVGQGGGIYDQTFRDPASLDRLLDEIRAKSGIRIHRLYLSGFSAGYGAIRAILRQRPEAVDGILLLDGLHTGYVGGKVDAGAMEPFLNYARAALDGRKRFVFTHSEIFPGTFASTTETADYLIGALGLKRTPVLRWGPRGMQQLSEVRAGGLMILGFAGNSAPDHVDHFHAMPEFLQLLLGGSP